MSALRFTTFAVSVALLVPLGPAQAIADTPPPPTLTESRTLDLRATGSRLVIDTIEDTLRQGGLALFDEGFQIDSSLNWVFGKKF